MIDIIDPTANSRAISAYEEAKRNLDAFIQNNHELMEELRHLVNRHNEALQNLEDRARHTGQTLGPVQKKGETCRVDAAKAEQTLGRERFTAIGGEVVSTPQLKIDQLREAVRSGQVSKKDYDEIVKVSTTFTSPRSLEVP